MPPVAVTLTPAQFRQTAAARSGGTYKGYLKYVQRARASRGGSGVDPTGLGQTPNGQITAAVNRLVKMFGSSGNPSLAPETDAQLSTEAKRYAQSQTQPLIDEVTKSLTSRAARGMSSIGDLSKALISEQTPAANGYMGDALRAAAARSAIGQNLAGQAGAEGQQQQSDVAGKLAQIGATDASHVFADNAGALGRNLAGTLGTHAATGAADTVDRGAAQAGQASALPGITALGAERSGRLLQEQTGANLADQVGNITKSVPGLVTSIFENLKSRELSKENMREGLRARKAGAAESLLTHLGDQNVQKAIARMGLGTDLTKLGLQASQFDTSSGIAKQNANTAATRAATAAETAAAKVSGTDANSVRTATSKAVSKASTYISQYVKPQPIYKVVKDPISGTSKKVIDHYAGYPSYYSVIHGIESYVKPMLLQVGLGEADITRFVQQIVNANPHYKPGANGRPGTGTAAPSVLTPSGHPTP